MGANVYLFLSLILFLPANSVPAVGSPSDKLSSQQPEPLKRAADEFKSLTRDLGMRPDSPPTARAQKGRKTLWHGRVYENFRNEALDALPHEVKQNGQDKSPLRRNQFGFNISGPLLIPHIIKDSKNKFFMVSYEGVRERISRASLHTVPTAAERNGDFSQTVDPAGNPLPIYDPATTVSNPSYDPGLPVSTGNLQYLRSPFPGNIIPANRLAPDIQEALSLYPMPNTNIGPFFQNNYFVNSPQTDTADGIIAKLDLPFGERHRVTSVNTVSNGFLGPAKYFPNIASPTAPDREISSLRTDLDYVFIASSNFVNTASLTMTSDVVVAGDQSQDPFPRYELGNYLSMGTPYPNSRRARNSFIFGDGLSTRHGKHSLSLNLRGVFRQVNSFIPQYPSGEFQFSDGITSLPGIINTGYPFASFLLGLAQYGERTITTSPSYFRNSDQSISAKDKYEFSKNLTIAIGFNFSHRTPRTEKYDHQSTVDPSVINPSNGRPGALVFAGLNGIPGGIRPGNIDFDPSASISWNPRGDAKTVVRASFSRTHDEIPIYSGQWGTQGFNAHQTFISPNTQLNPALDLTSGIPPYTTVLPDLNPSAADDTVADFMDLSGREPVYQAAALSLEREIPFSMLVSVGTTYRAGRDILVGSGAFNPNAIDLSFLSYRDALYDESFRVTLQPYPQYKGFELYGLYPAGRYERSTAFVRVEKRASSGLSFIAYYQYSRQFDDYSGPYGNQDFFNLRNNWSPTSYNTPQYLQLSYIYELPFRFSDWRGPLVKGWSISGRTYWNEGTPLAPHPVFNNTGGVLSTLNVNVVPGVDPHVANPGPDLWFNPAAFDQPADFTPGDGPRTMANLLGPSYNSMDLSLNKRIPVGGGQALEVGAAAFNLLNHGNWNSPDPNIGPASALNVNAGKIIGSHGGRVIQIGMRYSF